MTWSACASAPVKIASLADEDAAVFRSARTIQIQVHQLREPPKSEGLSQAELDATRHRFEALAAHIGLELVQGNADVRLDAYLKRDFVHAARAESKGQRARDLYKTATLRTELVFECSGLRAYDVYRYGPNLVPMPGPSLGEELYELPNVGKSPDQGLWNAMNRLLRKGEQPWPHTENLWPTDERQ